MNLSETKFKPKKPNTKPICIIPARAGSKRIENKNKLRLSGKTLVEHAIKVALGSNLFQLIIVTSDDEQILEIAYKYFYHGLVQPHKRPEKMAQDDTTLRHVCLHALRCYRTASTEFCLLIPNNPFRTPVDLQKAYKIFRKTDSNYLITVKPYEKPPQLALSIEDGLLQPKWGHDEIKQSQELETLYYEDGAISFAKISAFAEEFDLNFYGSKCLPYILPHPTIEIDTKEDWECAKYLWTQFTS